MNMDKCALRTPQEMRMLNIWFLPPTCWVYAYQPYRKASLCWMYVYGPALQGLSSYIKAYLCSMDPFHRGDQHYIGPTKDR